MLSQSCSASAEAIPDSDEDSVVDERFTDAQDSAIDIYNETVRK